MAKEDKIQQILICAKELFWTTPFLIQILRKRYAPAQIPEGYARKIPGVRLR